MKKLNFLFEKQAKQVWLPATQRTLDGCEASLQPTPCRPCLSGGGLVYITLCFPRCIVPCLPTATPSSLLPISLGGKMCERCSSTNGRLTQPLSCTIRSTHSHIFAIKTKSQSHKSRKKGQRNDVLVLYFLLVAIKKKRLWWIREKDAIIFATQFCCS